MYTTAYNVREGWSFTKPGEGSPGVWFQWGFGKRPYTLSSLFLCTVPKYSRILLFEQLQKCKSRLMPSPHKPSWERGTLKLARWRATRLNGGWVGVLPPSTSHISLCLFGSKIEKEFNRQKRFKPSELGCSSTPWWRKWEAHQSKCHCNQSNEVFMTLLIEGGAAEASDRQKRIPVLAPTIRRFQHSSKPQLFETSNCTYTTTLDLLCG